MCTDAYKSIRESLSHAGTYNDHKVKITFINSEYLTEENVAEAIAAIKAGTAPTTQVYLTGIISDG